MTLARPSGDNQKRAILESAYRYSEAFQELMRSDAWKNILEALEFLEQKHLNRLVSRERPLCRERIKALRWLKRLPLDINRKAQALFKSQYARGFSPAGVQDPFEQSEGDSGIAV